MLRSILFRSVFLFAFLLSGCGGMEKCEEASFSWRAPIITETKVEVLFPYIEVEGDEKEVEPVVLFVFPGGAGYIDQVSFEGYAEIDPDSKEGKAILEAFKKEKYDFVDRIGTDPLDSDVQQVKMGLAYTNEDGYQATLRVPEEGRSFFSAVEVYVFVQFEKCYFIRGPFQL